MEKSVLKIKPYTNVNTADYPFANGIMWECSGIYRNCTDCWLYASLVNVSDETYIDESGNTQTIQNISSSLKNFDMIVPNTILQSWGSDDTIIDSFVLTHDPNFERE